MATNPTQFTPKAKNKLSSLLIMTVLAMFLGLIAAVGIWQYLSKTQQQVKELSITRPVVVAGKQILAGAKLDETNLLIKQLPAQGVPKDYPSSIQSVKGRIAKSTLQPEEIVTEARLVGEGAAGGLPIVIPHDKRAITIRVNEVIGVGGFINPGDRVDVLSVLKKDENTFSKIILQNILVLAVGDKILDPNAVSDPQAKIVSQVTLALSPVDSEKLALASETGQLHLVLRPHGEGHLSLTSGATLEDVYGYLPMSPNEISNLPAIPVSSSASNKNSIEIILGNQRTYQYY